MRIPTRSLVFIAALLACCGGQPVQTPETEADGPPPNARRDEPMPARFRTEIAAAMASEEMRGASFAFCLYDCAADSFLVDFEGEKSLHPASTLKLLTTATALRALGEGFRFETVLAYSGEIENGTLKGDLIIIGDGDPTLSDPVWVHYPVAPVVEWAFSVKEAGIRRVEGRLVGDASVFDEQQAEGGWPWSDVANYYGAGASGLSFHRNLYYLDFKSGASRTEVLGTRPEVPGLSFVNEVRAEGSRDNAYVYGAPYSFERIVRGTIPPGRSRFTIKGALPDPALFAAQRLEQALKSQGVALTGQATTARRLRIESAPLPAGERTTLDTVRSPALAQIVAQTNYSSINLYAEALLRRVGHEANGRKPGTTTADGLEAMADYWEGQGVDVSRWRLRDGSGLSPTNAIDGRSLCVLLAKMREDEAFLASLPVSGRSGTLRSFCADGPAAGKVRAKSGSMDGVRAYAGYVEAADGRRLAFAAFANQYAGSSGAVRARIERLVHLAAQTD